MGIFNAGNPWFCRRLSAAANKSGKCALYSAVEWKLIEQPLRRLSNKLPSVMALSEGSPRRIRWHLSPSCAATKAVARQWFDWIPPQVINAVNPPLLALAAINSSLRTLLPLSTEPVISSRFSQIKGPPRSACKRRKGCKGVGVWAKQTLGG